MVPRKQKKLLTFKLSIYFSTLQFYIVTGGISRGSGSSGWPVLDSTEILKKGGGNSWQKVASLPSVRAKLRGVSLANGHFVVSGEELVIHHIQCSMFITGGQNLKGKNIAEVLDYDPDADKWTRVGFMAKARGYHGMSLVPKETADYCV